MKNRFLWIDTVKLLEFSRQFLSWWFSELSQLVSARFTQWLSPSEVNAKLVVDQDRTQLIRFNHQETDSHFSETLEFEVPLSSLHKHPELIVQLENISGAVEIDVSPALILQREIELPSAAANNYIEIIRLQAERYLPMPECDIYLDARLQNSSAATARIKVQLAMVKKTLLQPLQSLIENHGAWISRISGLITAADVQNANSQKKHGFKRRG